LRRIFAGRRILLAEDNLLNQEVALDLLEHVGLAVTVADDGDIALEMAAKAADSEPFELILMDLQMPKLDGLEAARRLRSMPAYTQTPILAMTANAFDEDRTAVLAAGMNDHIAKPVEPDQLYGTIARWLGVTQAEGTLPNAGPAQDESDAGETTAAAPQDIDWPQLAQGVARLRALIAADEMGAADALHRLQPELATVAERAVARLARELDNFDYDLALTTLDAIIAAEPRLHPITA
jgi:CheY-like chemotaxis protein